MTANDSLQKQINYWRNSAERNFTVAQSLFFLKHYDACLFFCHLSLEKILKALFVKYTGKPAPYIHDLEKLSVLDGLKPDKKQIQLFKTISTFNIAARYDDAKLEFYKQCTKNYAQKYLTVTQQLYLWLKKQFPHQ